MTMQSDDRNIDPLQLWYNKPAAIWEEALPLGNGRLGAMVFGHPYSERIALNEDSVWYGGPRNRNNPNAYDHLAEIRKLLLEGAIPQAQQLAAMALSGVPETQRHYLPLGDLLLFVNHVDGELSNYRRELDIATGIATVNYSVGDTSYSREIFTSFPEQALIIRLTSSDQRISLRAKLARGSNRYYDELVQVGQDTIVMRGNCGGQGGSDFRIALKAVAEGGSISMIGEHLIINDAHAVTLILTAGTTFRFEDVEQEIVTIAEKAATLPYADLRKRHVADVTSLMSRVTFKLEGDYDASLPTDERLERVRNGQQDLALLSLYYQFGRYLLVASSRPGSLPANLQGIWNEKMLPDWDSKYTININTQMNYWPAESSNLAECHEPLFQHIERMREPGRVTAREMYQCGGFVSHHNTDIWGDTAPQDIYMPATYWTLGAAWLCLHLWEHYEYSRDQQFLDSVYPTIKEAAQFFVDFLYEDEQGQLLTVPSVSPENSYILPSGVQGILCAGPAMDNQILHELFTACIEGASILGTDELLIKRWATIRSKLPKPQIGKHGQLLEWLEDYDEVEPGHRHISHLFALYPGKQFNLRTTPEWTEAAKVTLERRLASGGGHTGWSRAWIINLWARLEDGEKAEYNVAQLLAHSTLPNLFDNHPPFQIDGNFGGTAGITEMLMQSHMDEIHLLPALPQAWNSGSITGLRARNGFEISMEWEQGKVTSVQINATLNLTCRIRLGGRYTVHTANGVEINTDVTSRACLQWEAMAGERYIITAIL
ncbi:glycoside hydrolase family 95 protein [Paenibacillus sp. FA6]|uniref:glycoside hydrolase family 95 protein n=1 Tax=Paenibacillus sp. FA6 TaxID=3413029 RepID=UPI003F65E258